MTISEFLEKVKGLNRVWSKNDYGSVRCEKGDCPIIAVVVPDNDSRYTNYYATLHGTNYGLSRDDAFKIIMAADKYDRRNKINEITLRYDRELRINILDACGLPQDELSE